MVLPMIKETLKAYPDIKIFVDCHIDTGVRDLKSMDPSLLWDSETGKNLI